MLRALLTLLAFVASSATAVELREARVVSGADTSRVILDLSARTPHRFSRLAGPDRLVLDISGAHLKSPPPRLGAAGSIKGVRLARRGKHDLRVVVDLARPVKARSYWAAPDRRSRYRLVVELSETSAAVPASTPAAATPAAAVSAAVPPRETPVTAAHAPAESRDLMIAIDAGHGGQDPGATGRNGTHEKDVVLAIARELALQVNAEPGMRAALIRDGDYFIPLRDRMQRARKRQADLFVSVHADSIRNRAVTGSSVYILSQRGATDEAARWLAERENAADLVGGVSLENKDDVLASVLLDLSQTAALNASQAAASSVLRRLDQVGEIRKRQVQQARFIVLKSPDVPSMLVETAYISNPGEEQRLRSRTYQGKIAVAIQQGIRDYFYASPPAGTRVAQLAAQKAAPPNVALVGKLEHSGT